MASISDALLRLGVNFAVPTTEPASDDLYPVVSENEGIQSLADLEFLSRIAIRSRDASSPADDQDDDQDDEDEETQRLLNAAREKKTFLSGATRSSTVEQLLISKDGDFLTLLGSQGSFARSLFVSGSSCTAELVSCAAVFDLTRDIFLAGDLALRDPGRDPELACLLGNVKSGDYGLPTLDGVGWRTSESAYLKSASFLDGLELVTDLTVAGRIAKGALFREQALAECSRSASAGSVHSHDRAAVRAELVIGLAPSLGDITPSHPLRGLPASARSILSSFCPPEALAAELDEDTPNIFSFRPLPGDYVHEAILALFQTISGSDSDPYPSSQAEWQTWMERAGVLQPGGLKKARQFGSVELGSVVKRSLFVNGWSAVQIQELPRLDGIQAELDVSINTGRFAVSAGSLLEAQLSQVEDEEAGDATLDDVSSPMPEDHELTPVRDILVRH